MSGQDDIRKAQELAARMKAFKDKIAPNGWPDPIDLKIDEDGYISDAAWLTLAEGAGPESLTPEGETPEWLKKKMGWDPGPDRASLAVRALAETARSSQDQTRRGQRKGAAKANNAKAARLELQREAARRSVDEGQRYADVAAELGLPAKEPKQITRYLDAYRRRLAMGMTPDEAKEQADRLNSTGNNKRVLPKR